MVLKSQITTMRKLKAICLFAPHQSDRQYSQKLKAHFRYFQKLYLQQLDCWEVKKQNATDLDALLGKVDVIFLITSMELINALEENYSIKAKLERVTNQQKAKVILNVQ